MDYKVLLDEIKTANLQMASVLERFGCFFLVLEIALAVGHPLTSVGLFHQYSSKL